MRLFPLAVFAALTLAALPLRAQMSMGAHDHSVTDAFIAYLLEHWGSGTSAEPASTPTPMLMSSSDGWMFMLHGLAFATDQQQSGPRGYDKFFSTNWIMGMASRPLGQGQLTLRAMFSLEPATITDRRYPLLLQTGETAFGNPLVDAQHPHNFFMELAALYDYKLDEHTLLSLYAAPMGDPAIGPRPSRIALPPRMIRSLRWAIILRIPRISPPMSSAPAWPIASCGSKDHCFTAANRTKTAGPFSPARSIPIPGGSPPIRRRIGAGSSPGRTFTAPKHCSRAKTKSA